MPDPDPSLPEDLLARLEARLNRATEAAESLIAEAGAAASGAPRGMAGERPPPAGWQTRLRESAASSPGDLDLLMQVLGSLRELVPTELEQRLADALRELLLALRALLDWYLERAERRRRDPPDVEDIPIL